MDLAKLIHQTLTNAATQHALERGEAVFEGMRLSPNEAAAVAAALHDSRYLCRNDAESLFDKLFNTVCCWQGEPTS